LRKLKVEDSGRNNMTNGVFKTGLENLQANPGQGALWGRVGLVCNQASVDSNFTPAWEVFNDLFSSRLVALFGPQHGFYGTAQDNMIETSHTAGGEFNLPIFSLYSETREPTPSMLANVDTLVIDLQITGCRIYTWKSTIAGCLRAARRDGKRVVVLDRPNPIGGVLLEGRVLESNASSFVGQFPTPMRHGLTAGEAALFFNQSIGADLHVVKLTAWNPALFWCDLQRPWILTSPNLPTIDPVYVYPGTVIFEGTNISEGRGTGLPFQFAGAPYIKSSKKFVTRIKQLLGGPAVPGVHLREASFEPTSQKWAGKVCNGLQIHVVEPSLVRSYDLALAVVRAAFELGGDAFAWKDPPYEYDYKTLPMKLIMGSLSADQKLTASVFDLSDSYWHGGIKEYIAAAEKILLYDRQMKQAL